MVLKATLGAKVIQVKLPNGIWTYDPQKPLGTPGGFGAVFAGKSSSGEPVAVKKLHLGATDAAHRELKIASELANRKFEHVMPVLDAGQDSESDGYFVIMPVADQSLQDVLNRNGAMEEAQAVEVVLQVTLGLTELPDLVHRDLKPANVLLLNGSWKIRTLALLGLSRTAPRRGRLRIA